MGKLVTVKTRISPAEHAQLRDEAQEQDRSIASILRTLIREKLATKEAAS
jgi:hypothetical protein